MAGIGVGVVGALAALALLQPADDGFLLAAEDVDIVRDVLRQRGALADLDLRLQAGAGADEPTARLRARRTLLAARLRHGRFADRSTEDLRRGLEAADDGRFAPHDGVGLRGVYGARDDREDYDALATRRDAERDPRERAFLDATLEAARGVGAWMDVNMLRMEASPRPLVGPTLGELRQLCGGERFAEQPAAGLGTAFLVAPDVVVTAAHVLENVALDDLVLVFDYEVREGEAPIAVRDVYAPRRVLDEDTGNGAYDWAVVELDREVVGGHVFEVAPDTQRARVHRDQALYMWGHSCGTPKKFAGGSVRSNGDDRHSLRVHIDAFGGDSGSPVFNRDHQVVGILFGGSEDFAWAGGCASTRQVSGRAGGEYVTRVECFQRALP